MSIPVEFYNETKAGEKHPKVKTVGELINQLNRLPSNLPLTGNLSCVVYNIDNNPFFELEDYYEDEDVF